MRFTIGTITRTATLAAALLAGLASTAWAQQATISGRVIDQNTQPVAGAQVSVRGTTLGAVTDRDGRYRIEGVAPGRVTVSVRAIGFAGASQIVTASAGATLDVNFGLRASAVALDAVVVTASGEEQSARELGNSIATIDAAKITDEAPVTSMADLLNSRTGNVTVTSAGGTTGAGVRVRIRGSNSVSIANEPVLIVDGVRVENAANSSTIGVGGQSPSRINDLNPEDIESIEIIKGPAAAALYGTAAANGIIQVRTKRGQPGPARWTFYTEGGSVRDFTGYPANFDSNCFLFQVADGDCTQTSLTSFNPLEVNSPFRTGGRQQYGANVTGGSEVMTYFVSGEMENENGIYEISNLKRYNLRTNVTAQVSQKTSINVSAGYVSSDLQRPQNDNNSLGILPSGLLGLPDSTNGGYLFLTPEQSMSIASFQRIERFTGGVTVDFKPFSFLTTRGVIGVDMTGRTDEETVFPGKIPEGFDTDLFLGSRAANRAVLYNTTANFNATASYNLTPIWRATTSVGVQYFREYANTIAAFGQNLIAGSNSLGGTALPTVDEATGEAKTLGAYVEERVGFRDRLFLTAALRGDDNSAFGQDFDFVAYPKVSASWVISEEPFFPNVSQLSSLRLRAAYGQSGLQPGTNDARLFYVPVTVTEAGSDELGFTSGNLGNPGLKPEKSGEVEVGLDAGLFRDRVQFEFTYYAKKTRDALIARRVAPSVGETVTQFENLGQVSNKGVEIGLNARVIDRPQVAVDVSASAWGNKNRLIELGEGIEPIIFGLGGASQRHQEGYPLGSYFLRPIIYSDANGDGLIGSSEVSLGPTPVFLGTPFPTHGGSLSATVTLGGGRVRVYGLLDGRFGHKQFNDTEEFRCAFTICAGLHDPSSSVEEQAKALGTALLGSDGGYVEDAGFVKLREVSVTFQAPAAWAAQLRAKGLSFTLTGRNLGTWTKYTGFDPEILGGGQQNFNTFEFLSQPPVRTFLARVNVNF
ncbi:MAG: SusC/RagA family TonB-linked outer membrane protein [Gemmatimonadales bacterium]|nr:SusC/RagA family TonB-linked outer membrane protein [Gemmatimonadales bacterium]